MVGIASKFSAEERVELEKQLGVVLDDEHDYSEDEIEELYENVTDNFPYAFDEKGNPLRMGRIFERIIDTLLALRGENSDDG